LGKNPRNFTKISKGFILSEIIMKLNSLHWKGNMKFINNQQSGSLLTTATTYISGRAEKEHDAKFSFKKFYFRS
jgi:hypothetical protein